MTGFAEQDSTCFSAKQLAAHHCHGLSEEIDAIAAGPDPDDPSALRDLVPHKLRLVEPLGPVGRQAAMGCSRHWILVDSQPGSEEARDEIARPGVTWGCDDARIDPAGSEMDKIGLEATNRVL